LKSFYKDLRAIIDVPLTSDDSILRRVREGIVAARSASYILIIIIVVFATYAYKLRAEGIFSCQANGYSAHQYLAYCQAVGYGDYEHGAFWFDLEPRAEEFASRADVIFLGNSRMQLAFSTGATADWFSSSSAQYYLLGFSAGGNSAFADKLLGKLRPQAKAYVINVDPFFEQRASRSAQTVMTDPAAPNRYRAKLLWQRIHAPICESLPAVCRDQYVVFRSRETGAYLVNGVNGAKSSTVSYVTVVDQESLGSYAAVGREFLSQLPVAPECVILTMVPTAETKIGTANAIAAALGMKVVAPELEGLRTFDGSHLDHPSAERWSKAFLEMAAPQIRACMMGLGRRDPNLEPSSPLPTSGNHLHT
jgi:hypothetical protein